MELEYLKLLFYSLDKNLVRKDHEFLVFVDISDDQIISFLQSQRSIFPDVKIVRNNRTMPVLGQENMNYMFREAKYEIVSYLQSDMVVGPKYDAEILKHVKKDTLVCATRIEPPLHPTGAEKFTMDWEIYPQDFKEKRFEEFCKFCVDNKSDKMTDFFFAPYTFYKEVWNKIGGHDRMFRASRDDSDTLWRLLLTGVKVKQCWDTFVYHFTCTSSRGIEWWKSDEQTRKREEIRVQADQIEMMKFLRKWGTFKHPSTPEQAKHYKYSISSNIVGCKDSLPTDLLYMFVMFNRVNVDSEHAYREMKPMFDALVKPGNILRAISDDDWKKYGKYYDQPKFENIFKLNTPVDDDIIVNMDMRDVVRDRESADALKNLQEILHGAFSESDDVGEFELAKLKVQVNKIRNVIDENIYSKNTEYVFDVDIL